jgi:hypothetical protein
LTLDSLDIRIAGTDEMTNVMNLAIAGAEENAFLDASALLIAQTVYPALAQDHGLCGVIGPKGDVQAFIVLRIGTLYYSDQPCVEEKILYVHPDFRSAKGGRAAKLCQFSKKVADDLDLPLLIGVCSSHRTAGKVKMYERIFGPPAGAYFLYRTKTGGHAVS